MGGRYGRIPEEHTGITCSMYFGEARLHVTAESVVTGSTPDPVTEQFRMVRERAKYSVIN